MGTQILKEDFRFIDGGSAGCPAGKRSPEIKPELNALIFEMGDFKDRESVACGRDALNLVAIPDFTIPRPCVESHTLVYDGILEASLSSEMAERSFPLLKKLEGWSAYFAREAKENYLTLQYQPVGNFPAAMREEKIYGTVSSGK